MNGIADSNVPCHMRRFLALHYSSSQDLRQIGITQSGTWPNLISWFLYPCTSARRLSNLCKRIWNVAGRFRWLEHWWALECRFEPFFRGTTDLHGRKRMWKEKGRTSPVNATCSLVAQTLDDASFLSYCTAMSDTTNRYLIKSTLWENVLSLFGLFFVSYYETSCCVHTYVMMIASTINLPRKVNLTSWFQSGYIV